MQKVFLLSPAKITGKRAGFLLNPGATFALARQLQDQGVSLGDAFAFASGLYFRGKLTYARRFTDGEQGHLVRVITSNAGLVDPMRIVSPEELLAFGNVDIHEDDPRYHTPLRRDARELAEKLSPRGTAILLGSIATAKYRDILLECFGPRLVFPQDFVGRGDMSRGGLLLRAAREGVELPYINVEGATFRGQRAQRMGPTRRTPRKEPP